jgi:hypothetical protein
MGERAGTDVTDSRARCGPYELVREEYGHPVVLWHGREYLVPTGFPPGFDAGDDGYVRRVVVDDRHIGPGPDFEMPALFRGLWAWGGPLHGTEPEHYHLNLELWAPGGERHGAGIGLDESTARALMVSLDAWLRQRRAVRENVQSESGAEGDDEPCYPRDIGPE